MPEWAVYIKWKREKISFEGGKRVKIDQSEFFQLPNISAETREAAIETFRAERFCLPSALFEVYIVPVIEKSTRGNS